MSTPICPYCGSDDIVVDALAAWDPDVGGWEVHSTYDAFHCNACGEDSKYCNWKEETS
jgi:predicted RNA-binding Zn-ribbon protein involved in translation (DUF1610 family)